MDDGLTHGATPTEPDPDGEVAEFGAGYDPERPDPTPVPAWADVAKRLESARNYWVVTRRPDGRPHAAPIWGLWWRGTLWFSTGPNTVKARNLLAEPSAVVHLESGDDVVVVEADIDLVPVPADVDGFIDAYEAKYGFRPTAQSLEGGLFRLAPKQALTWSEQVFPLGKVRWRFRGRTT